MNEARKPRPVVHVVDGDAAVSQALRFLLASAKLECRAYPDLRLFLEDYLPERPGCLLLDVRMQGISALEFLDRRVEFGVLLPVIVLTGHGDVSLAVGAMKAGAVDFLEKPVRPQQVLDAVRLALRADSARRRERDAHDDVARRLAALSVREREVAERVALGRISRQIAEELGISPRTVETHRASALRKLGLRNSAALARLLAQHDALQQRTRRA